MRKKIKLCLFIGIMVSVVQNHLIAQDKPKHEPKVFVSQDGKMYWNKGLPVYIRLSPSKNENAPNYLMNSEATPKYADPFYLDTEGINYLRSQWAVNPETKIAVTPQLEVLWEVYRDGIAPTSSIVYEKAKYVNMKGKIFGLPGLEVVLSAKDELSGLENIMYSINQSPYVPYQQPIVFTEEKEHELKYYSVDNVGNVEEVKIQTIIIDKSPPHSRHTFIGDRKDNIVSSKSSFEIKSEDNLVGLEGIYFKINNQAEKKYQNPISFAQLTEEDHSISYYAVDNLGHKEEMQVVRFFIDNTPPIIAADMLGDSYIVNGKEYSSSRTRVQITAVDNKAGVKSIFYSINGGEYQEYESPFFLSGTQGTQKITYYAVDHVGNKSSNATGKETLSLSYLDLTGPILSYGFIGPRFFSRDTIFISDNTKIELKGVDHESGLRKITYSINGGEEKDYEEPFMLQEERPYLIDYYGFDNVINSSQSSFVVVVDKEGPEIMPQLSISPITQRNSEGSILEVFSEHVVLFLAATDKMVGYESLTYSINDGKKTEYINPIKGFKKGQTYTISFTATDKLGNMNNGELKFAIEN